MKKTLVAIAICSTIVSANTSNLKETDLPKIEITNKDIQTVSIHMAKIIISPVQYMVKTAYSVGKSYYNTKTNTK